MGPMKKQAMKRGGKSMMKRGGKAKKQVMKKKAKKKLNRKPNLPRKVHSNVPGHRRSFFDLLPTK